MDEKQIQEHITALEQQKNQIDDEVDRLLIQKDEASSKSDIARVSKLVTQLTDLNFKQVEIEEQMMDLEEQLYEIQTKNLENKKTIRGVTKSVSEPRDLAQSTPQKTSASPVRTRMTQSQSFAGSSKKVSQLLGENPLETKTVGKLSKFFGESHNDIQTLTKNSLRSNSMSVMPTPDTNSTPSSTHNNNPTSTPSTPSSPAKPPTSIQTSPSNALPNNTNGTIRKPSKAEEIPQSSTQYGVIPSTLSHLHPNPFDNQSSSTSKPKSNYQTIPQFLENLENSKDVPQSQPPKEEPTSSLTSEPNIFQELLKKYPVFSTSASTLRSTERSNSVTQQPQISAIQEDTKLDSPRTHVRKLVRNNSSWEIEFSELEFPEENSFVLDQDYNIVVKKAMWREQEVFFKEWKSDRRDNTKKWEHYKEEVSLLVTLKMHQNVLKIYGICVQPEHPLGLVTEWLDLGPLKFLLESKSDEIGKLQLIQIIRDISRGMKHLHLEGVIHGRLCARSVLVSEMKNGWECKISSFGMTKSLQGQNQINEANKNMIRWMAPETLLQGVFNQKSDSWMLGCTISEILWGGKDPYFDIPDPIAAATMVVNDSRKPTLPDDCPALLADLHVSLVHPQPDRRPDFVKILKTLDAVEEDIKSNPFY